MCLKIKQFISRVLFLDNHLSEAAVTHSLQAICPKLADNLSLRVNLAFGRGLPIGYFSIPMVKLLTHRCTIACEIAFHRQSPFLWHFPPVHTVRSFSGDLSSDARTFLTLFGRDCSAALFINII